MTMPDLDDDQPTAFHTVKTEPQSFPLSKVTFWRWIETGLCFHQRAQNIKTGETFERQYDDGAWSNWENVTLTSG